MIYIAYKEGGAQGRIWHYISIKYYLSRHYGKLVDAFLDQSFVAD
jgi:hypothetical protein